MNLIHFKYIYEQLKQDPSNEEAMVQLYDNLPLSLDYLKLQLDKEAKGEAKQALIALYNEITAQNYPTIIDRLLRRGFVNQTELFAHFSAYIYEKTSYEVQAMLDNVIQRWIKRLDKKILESGEPQKIIEEINTKITSSYVIDDSFLSYYDYTEMNQQGIVSQYSLAMLYLVLAESLNLPIFGIPFPDKLVLCYAREYCQYSEEVCQEDILCYIVIGEKDIIYTPHDLELYAALLDQSLKVVNTIPAHPEKIMKAWLNHLRKNPFQRKVKTRLSSIYQQIFARVEEF